jgi:hypothetical protein
MRVLFQTDKLQVDPINPSTSVCFIFYSCKILYVPSQGRQHSIKFCLYIAQLKVSLGHDFLKSLRHPHIEQKHGPMQHNNIREKCGRFQVLNTGIQNLQQELNCKRNVQEITRSGFWFLLWSIRACRRRRWLLLGGASSSSSRLTVTPSFANGNGVLLPVDGHPYGEELCVVSLYDLSHFHSLFVD